MNDVTTTTVNAAVDQGTSFFLLHYEYTERLLGMTMGLCITHCFRTSCGPYSVAPLFQKKEDFGDGVPVLIASVSFSPLVSFFHQFGDFFHLCIVFVFTSFSVEKGTDTPPMMG